jgi:hypothetical protein
MACAHRLLQWKPAQDQVVHFSTARHGDVGGKLAHQADEHQAQIVFDYGGGTVAIRHPGQRAGKVVQRGLHLGQGRRGRRIDGCIVGHRLQNGRRIGSHQQVTVFIEPLDRRFDNHECCLAYTMPEIRPGFGPSGRKPRSSGKAIMPDGKDRLPSSGAHFPSGGVIPPVGVSVLPCGKTIFPHGKASLPVGAAIFPSG